MATLAQARARAAVSSLSRSLASGCTTTATRAELRELLLATGGTLFSRGRLCNIKSKSLGADVYLLSLEETP